MLFITPDDMSYMAFVNLVVFMKDWGSRPAILIKFQDSLLVLTWDLGIGNDERWENCMCLATETASDALDDKWEEKSQELEMSLIMTIEDQAATTTAFAFHHVGL